MDVKGAGGNAVRRMSDSVNVLVVAGMIDRKLLSKVLPLVKSETVNRIYLVRRDFISVEKMKCFSPKGIFRQHILLAELYRLIAIIYILMRFKPKVVIGIGLILHGIYTNVLGSLFKKKKILLIKGKNDLALTNPDRRILQRMLLRVAFLADFMGMRGTRSRDWITERGFRADRLFIPHNVFDFKEFVQKDGCAKKYDLIYVGLLNHYKRIDVLLEVVHKLVHKHDLRGVQLAILGGGKLRKGLQKQCESLGLGQNVHFLPTGGAAYVCGVLNQSKVFVMTSQGEGLPMAMIEAMSCGLPVVIFEDADVGDIVRHGENGLLIKLGDLDGFSEAVRRLLQDSGFHNELSQGASRIRDEYKDHFSMERIRRVWDQVLMKNLGQPGGQQ